MAFKTIPGIEGKVFVPDTEPRARKHPCPDCYACQQCSEDRCRLCRADEQPAPGSPSPRGIDRQPAGCDGCCCH